MLSVILIGPPGCGKGTQSAKLIAECGFQSFSTGDELRKEIASGSELGLKIKQICENGGLVSDEIVNTMARNFVKQAKNEKLLFDGFPRKVTQAEALDQILIEFGKADYVKAYLFDVADDVILDRVLNRFSCAKCGAIYNKKTNRPKVEGLCDYCGSCDFIFRKDDNENSMKVRLENYYKMTDPVVDFYEKRGILRRIDASLSESEVFQQLESGCVCCTCCKESHCEKSEILNKEK